MTKTSSTRGSKSASESRRLSQSEQNAGQYNPRAKTVAGGVVGGDGAEGDEGDEVEGDCVGGVGVGSDRVADGEDILNYWLFASIKES